MLSSSQVELILILFIYGLAFFCMGLAMALESGRSPLLAEARVLRPLALFGFSHGIHEWLELALLSGQWLGLQAPIQLSWLRLVILVISFSSLVAYGMQSLRTERRLYWRDFYMAAGVLFFYLVMVVLADRIQPGGPGEWILHADILARYTLAIPGASLAALALERQAAQAHSTQRQRLAVHLQWVALSFALYGVTQAFVPRIDLFPANFLNSTLFLSLTGLPVQPIRALLAIIITVGLLRAIQEVEEERQAQFLSVEQSRLQALEQVRRDLVEREALRNELLRHTVIAQEDERARIARELHDETAQILTAFTLNLAALRDSLPKDFKAAGTLLQMQKLSRQMSEGIYRLVHDLRPAQLDDLGLVAALQYLIDEEKKRSGLQVTLKMEGSRHRLDNLVETVLFRVAQEAVSNIVRHANVRAAEIRICFLPQQVELHIHDQGCGFDPDENQRPPRGWGLAGMRERAESVGGSFQIRSSPGNGTLVDILVPVPAKTELESGKNMNNRSELLAVLNSTGASPNYDKAATDQGE